MFLTVCHMCDQGHHDKCQKGDFPGEGVFGGWKCTCPCRNVNDYKDTRDKEYKLLCVHGILISDYCSDCHTEPKRRTK